MNSRSVTVSFVTAALATLLPCASDAVTYEVGPGKPYASVGDVPWESLNAGDTVLIYYRPRRTRRSSSSSRVGTPSAPITVRGVLGPNGERPVLDGNGATTRAQLNYSSRGRGVIKIGASSVPFADGTIGHAPVDRDREPGDPRRARPQHLHRPRRRAPRATPPPPPSIYLEFGENITVRNCDLNNNGNGFFVFSSDTIATRNILVEGNYIHDNGNVGSNFEHNVYVEAIGVTFQYNHFGPLLPGRRRQQPQGPLGRPRRPLQLDRGRQPPARPRRRRGQRAGARRPALPRDPRLRQRDHRAPQQRQQRHRPLRRRQRARPRSAARARSTSTTTPSSPTARTRRGCSASPPTTRASTPATTSCT